MQEALQTALADAGLELDELDGLVASPSLSEPRFMEAHYLATRIGMLPNRGVRVRTIDTGGAGPISALLEATRMVKMEGCTAVAVVAGDAISSLPTDEFLRRADAGCSDPSGALPSPCIPHGYSRIAEWQRETYGVTREQLAMVAVLMSRQAPRHPLALTRSPHRLDDVLAAPVIAPSTGLLECARRADGGAAIIVASAEFVQRRGGGRRRRAGASDGVVILGGGEASGPLFPPPVIDETLFSCEQAARIAFAEAQLRPDDIDFWGLYDCYPICFLRAVEAVGLAPKGGGGEWIEAMYERTSTAYAPNDFPINTHGGLLSFGAPWEAPALYNVIESVAQLVGGAGERQVRGARRALVYGNGGIFSHSAVAILAAPVDVAPSYEA
jgi:acetyl-CoA acetyltransferase